MKAGGGNRDEFEGLLDGISVRCRVCERQLAFLEAAARYAIKCPRCQRINAGTVPRKKSV